MNYIIEKSPRVSLPIKGSDQRYPVARIYCVGRNYAEHSREMGDDPDRDPPFFFCKDASCVVPVFFDEENSIIYPSMTSQLEYEVELVVALGKGGSNLTMEQARDAVLGYAVGLDMTRRDLQSLAKKKGRPWEIGKSFSQSAPISPIFLKQDLPDGVVSHSQIALKVNGEVKQLSHIANLTWSVEEVICKLSEAFELRPGDLIMTGTPENVGSVIAGDVMEASVEGLGNVSIKVQAPF
ncbi:Fumarylpyruvate hydrolase [Marinomonas spartinae]|uniref:Fumarylpyruvate hydrolase n=1 Tax=Marinomonas spartinae TaxID=1792290 RepID=A0A1A8TI13_9GAMM|nr:fumarylacetoacetate hydrolase family protein [Marinomonas spartinae]SBS26693.1 Fumarylpyruvate hydrolase [Marinomonas spartinae]SBS32934.1 Fumarylpyruvate hydrolase [Marinomonas spartinae]